LEHKSGINKAVPLNEAVLLLALAGASSRGVLLGGVHTSDDCSAVKYLPPHLIGTVGIAAMEGLDVAGEGGDEGIALHARLRLAGHASPPHP
jgi:hypothetical protein